MKITNEKFQELKQELLSLNAKIPELQSALQQAIDLGDGEHDNVMWQRAAENMSNAMSRIKSLEIVLKNAQIINSKKSISNTIEVGSYVNLLNMETKTSNKHQIVDEIESSPPEKISFKSPIGNSVIGKKAGDIVTVYLPTKTLKLKIISVT